MSDSKSKRFINFSHHTEKLMTVPVDDNEQERLLDDRMLAVTADTLDFGDLDGLD